jgi:hypothetical protein
MVFGFDQHPGSCDESDILDGQITGVENDCAGISIFASYRQRGRAMQHFRVKIDRQVEVQVFRDKLLAVGERIVILRK